ncbi:hypothetical protein BDDG_13501 [Blastomyces dermatitidis ATCC 18188]|uniref:Uncharacterized protein n=1 Tax=Ajellomyces dermatitidis (strain ATCC 18188 / CBS 674.68) TaxID=653446 RepID=A0A0J9ETD6_AJEDA|nr:hypothetical protein BDDG_13501 [Blastomyces dermatitidis ATCC 18188]
MDERDGMSYPYLPCVACVHGSMVYGMRVPHVRKLQNCKTAKNKTRIHMLTYIIPHPSAALQIRYAYFSVLFPLFQDDRTGQPPCSYVCGLRMPCRWEQGGIIQKEEREI